MKSTNGRPDEKQLNTNKESPPSVRKETKKNDESVLESGASRDKKNVQLDLPNWIKTRWKRRSKWAKRQNRHRARRHTSA